MISKVKIHHPQWTGKPGSRILPWWLLWTHNRFICSNIIFLSLWISKHTFETIKKLWSVCWRPGAFAHFFLVKFAEMEKKRHEDFKGRWFLWGRQPKELRITAMMSRLPRLGFEGWALNTYSILYVFPAWSLCSYFRTTEWLKRIKIIPRALGNAKHSQTSYHRPSIQATWIRDFCHWCQNIIPEFLNHKRE